ncbi:Conserved lipoprotein, partial [human gut metagenome]
FCIFSRDMVSLCWPGGANDVAVKLNFRNEKFDYIKQNKVDKIIIQNVRDSGFRFIVNDPQAINDIYKILS